MKGTQVTETIKASGQMIPRKQAGHMTATDHVITTKIFLAKSGPSTHEGGPFGFGRRGPIPSHRKLLSEKAAPPKIPMPYHWV